MDIEGKVVSLYLEDQTNLGKRIPPEVLEKELHLDIRAQVSPAEVSLQGLYNTIHTYYPKGLGELPMDSPIFDICAEVDAAVRAQES